MFNPFDMTQGQTGAGMQGFGQQFGLTPDQTRRAMEALLPAFALGLQRDSGQDPAGLLKLFTSPLLNQAVIRQAASVSGVGGQALRQMLPMMAGMVVASVVHMLLNQVPEPAPAPAAPPEPANPFLAGQAFWTEMMKGFALPTAEAAKPAAATRPAPVKPPSSTRPHEAKPAAVRPAPKEAKPSAEARPGAEAEPGRKLDVFQQMLLTGAEVQEDNVKAMKGIFDAFWTDTPAGAARKAAHPVRPAAAPVTPAAKVPVKDRAVPKAKPRAAKSGGAKPD